MRLTLCLHMTAIWCFLLETAAWSSRSLFAGNTHVLHTSSQSVHHHQSSPLQMNLLNDLGDMLSGNGNRLDAQTSLPYDPPFCPTTSCDASTVRTFAVQERLLSFTGEDFDISEITNGQAAQAFLRVRGALLHLPGKDKMRITSAVTSEEVLVLDRKLVAATPTYDIYRGGGEKIGWIEKKLIAMTDTFDVYMEGQGGFGVTGLLKPDPAYRISGDFLDRNFVFRHGSTNEVVARVSEDWVIEFDEFNHYQVQVAPGMDAILVLACLCAIDEEFDEEHKAKKEKAAAGGE